MLESGTLAKAKGVGLSGSFKIAKAEKPAAKKPAAKKVVKKTATKKPAAKKPAAKKTATKKASPKKGAKNRKLVSFYKHKSLISFLIWLGRRSSSTLVEFENYPSVTPNKENLWGTRGI